MSNGTPEDRPVQPTMDYAQTLEEVQRDLAKQWQDAYAAYLTALASTQKDLSDRLLDAYRTYIESLSGSWSQPEAQRTVADAYQSYVDSARQLWTTAEQTLSTAQARLNDAGMADDDTKARAGREYAEAVRKVAENPQQHEKVVSALNRFLTAVKTVQDKGYEQAARASEEYGRTVTATWKESAPYAALQQAYEKYSSTLQDAWAAAVTRMYQAAGQAMESSQSESR